jgi:hypothetical protein
VKTSSADSDRITHGAHYGFESQAPQGAYMRKPNRWRNRLGAHHRPAIVEAHMRAHPDLYRSGETEEQYKARWKVEAVAEWLDEMELHYDELRKFAP